MRYLNEFVKFDLEGFIKGKKFSFISVAPWKENDEEVGSRVSLLIDKDKTEYKNPKKEGNRTLTNSKERMTVKVRKPIDWFDNWEEDDEVVFVSYEKATPWSSRNNGFNDSLSVIAEIGNKDKGYGLETKKDDHTQTYNSGK